ncbi:uncharacterized protein LOC128887093 [Hylaeus anthracinus]|uniref:uncharacterized protein LOC128887093 n=1 Tax=Hylaeus anthracinus TaxID=313031 RepID=UPI0023B90612|nr:uncharacterized protein LOC128887093 [Hylaeus anthracinus]
MDFDLPFNFMPMFSIILLIIVTIVTVFQKLKFRWPVKVNCWFCNNDTKIWRQQLNWWLCPHCEQYNGFSKNDDYTYSIPEQYKIPSNEMKRYCRNSRDTSINKIAKNGLCNQCMSCESLKISKLSTFTPANEKNYEHELKQFKDSLEQRYPLCANCKITVHNTLHKQAFWLAKYKMSLFKQKPFRIIKNNATYTESIFRTISTILDSMVAYNMDFVFLPIGGLFFQFCACWVASTRKKFSDILLIFLWICIIILLPFKDSRLIKTDLRNTWFSLEYITLYHTIMLFISIIGFVNVKPKSRKSASSRNMSFKKMESSTKDTVLSDSCMTTRSDKYDFNTKSICSLGEKVTNQLPSNEINDCKLLCMEKPATTPKSIVFQSLPTNHESQLSTFINDKSVLCKPISLYKNGVPENNSLNDSLTTLSTLYLSEDKPKYATKTPKIFEKKVYNTTSSEIFKKLNNTCGKRLILSPPKLKSVTQASWVAGGYWHDGIDPPSLSRSSSQSSGFGSTGSNFAPSREPSVHEFDQCSVISDGTQSYYTSRQSNVSPVGSFCQQNLQSPFTELKNLVSNQTMKLPSPNLCTPKTLLPSQNHQSNGSPFMDQCYQGQNVNISDIKNPSEMQMFPSHTTIVTSPVWLSTLLCGSLILNIIVLCTTLLR